MFWNQCKLAWRNLSKNRFFTLLNIIGLGLGIACSLLILLWISDEQQMDAFQPNRDRLYTAYQRYYGDGKVSGDYDCPAPLAAQLKKEIPEVEYAACIDFNDNYTFQAGGKSLKESGGFAGDDFFHLFGFPLLQGDAAHALNTPTAIAISKAMAVRFFGSPEAAMGKTLRRDSINHWREFTVTAVFDDRTPHASMHFDFLLNWYAYLQESPYMNQWDNSGPAGYLSLRPGADPNLVRTRMKDIVQRLTEHPLPGHHAELDMQLLSEKYLHSRFREGNPDGGRIAYVRLFGIVAIFILLIACINFMNLTTARSMKRAREIGVRKVIGARRTALIGQFLGEAILLAALAGVLALLIAALLLPAFNSITGKHMQLPITNLIFWGQFAGLTILTGAIAGSYPALFLSSFRPVKVLKGTMTIGAGATLFRKGLVVFQFVLSTVLIIGTLVITNQIHYLRNASLGYDKENLVYIPIEGKLTEQYAVFKQEALKIQGISSVSCMNNSPTSIDNGTVNMNWDGKAPDYAPSFTQSSVGYDFIRTMGMKVLQGRDFSKDYPTDSVGYILNETAISIIGYTNPVGRNFTMWGKKGRIIGVIKDFHYASLHEKVSPIILRFNENSEDGFVLVKIASGQTRPVLEHLDRLCKQLNPAFPFTYQFADQQYQQFYASEQVIGQLSNYFAVLAILISCLGLLGLTLFTAEQRTKEIGIRKVLGAGAAQLFVLLSRDFLLLVLLAFLIATPIAGWAMHSWLADYAFHIELGAKVFLIAGLSAFVIAMLTVSFHSLRAARANPVRSLRSE